VRVHLVDRVALGADCRRLANGFDGRAPDVDAGADRGLGESVELALDPRERVRGEELRAVAGDEVARGGPTGRVDRDPSENRGGVGVGPQLAPSRRRPRR